MASKRRAGKHAAATVPAVKKSLVSANSVGFLVFFAIACVHAMANSPHKAHFISKKFADDDWHIRCVRICRTVLSKQEKNRSWGMPARKIWDEIAAKAFEEILTMENNPVSTASNSEFELRVRQAIRSAKNSFPQVAVMVFAFENSTGELSPDGKVATAFNNAVLMRLRSGLRESDSVALLRNGHIGVLLQSVQGQQDLNLVLNRILARLEEPVTIDNVAIPLEPRIGNALFPENGDSVESLIEFAEVDLASIATNRKTHTAYSSRSRSLFTPRQWMSELRQAIVLDQLFLTFQPKVNLINGPVTGVEVLLRWQHPEHGIIVPDQFIPVAERTGLIIPMTLWVLQQSLIQCRRWKEIGLDISVAVNLTMWNLETQELPDQIEALLRDTGVSPKNLEFEITETSIMSDPQRVIRTLNQIRQLGVRFAIDDFGTGYSSFAYLTKLPVSCIKIDKSFVQNIETDRDSSVIVRSIIELGHNLGLKVVAEGVETLQAKKTLTSFECDEGQGYYFCRPIPADAMTKFLMQPPAAVALGAKAPKPDAQTSVQIYDSMG